MFINKLWNASRFVSTNLEETNFDIDKIEKDLVKNYDSLELHEKWIISRVRHLSDMVHTSMEEYNFSEAGQELQIFTRNEFCDYYIEEFKLTKETSKYGKEVIVYIINKLLKLWHPYIPFVTAEIYNKLGFDGDIIEAECGKVLLPRDEDIEKQKKFIIDIIREIRSLRAENNIMPNKTIGLQIYAKNKNAEVLKEVVGLIAGIVKADSYEIVDKKPTDPNLAYGVIKA